MPITLRGLAPLLQVFDMPTSIAFYVDLLGFEIIHQSKPGPDFGWALLELEGTQLMLNTAYDEGERPPIPDPARVAAHADTIIYFGCPDVEGAYAHLMNDKDREMFAAVRAFNPYDLYSKGLERPNVAALRPYYEDLIAEFFPTTLKW